MYEYNDTDICHEVISNRSSGGKSQIVRKSRYWESLEGFELGFFEEVLYQGFYLARYCKSRFHITYVLF